MKQGILMVAVAALGLISGRAEAIYDETWERPLYRAEMVETDRSFWREIRSDVDVEITLNQRDGSAKPTSISLDSEQTVYCVTAPCPPIRQQIEYRIHTVRSAGCGSKLYVGQSVERNAFGHPVVRSIRLVDHSTRVCKDLKPFTWEVTTRNPWGQRRYFGGEPEGVVTIQSGK